MQLLSNISIDFVVKILLKTLTLTQIRFSGLFRRDNCCLLSEKGLKLSPKMTKNPKFSIFQSFHAIFVKFSNDFVEWNVENRQPGKRISPVDFSEETIAVSKPKTSQNDTEKDKQKTNDF